MKHGAGPAILIGGLVAGAFDVSDAVLSSYLRDDVPPAVILQSVADHRGDLRRRAAHKPANPTRTRGSPSRPKSSTRVSLVSGA